MHFSNLMLPSSTTKANHATSLPVLLPSANCAWVVSTASKTPKIKLPWLTSNAVIAGKQASEHNGSIFVLFVHKGKQLVKYSHHAHMNPEVHAHLIKWVTENNRPINVINNRELCNLLTAGQLNITLPSSNSISCDIQASFEKCQECIAKLLQEHPSHLHFATDAWTSLNHHAFVAWTVHLEYEGEMLSFLIDIIELLEVCYMFPTLL